MYKNAARFSQRATRSDYVLDRTSSRKSKGPKRKGNKSKRKRILQEFRDNAKRQEAFLEAMKQSGGVANFIEQVRKIISISAGVITPLRLASLLNDRRISDPYGEPWTKSSSTFLLNIIKYQETMHRLRSRYG